MTIGYLCDAAASIASLSSIQFFPKVQRQRRVSSNPFAVAVIAIVAISSCISVANAFVLTHPQGVGLAVGTSHGGGTFHNPLFLPSETATTLVEMRDQQRQMSSNSEEEDQNPTVRSDDMIQPPGFNMFLLSRFQSRKFLLAVALTAVSSVALFTDLATTDQWIDCNEYVYGLYSGSNVVKGAMEAIGLKQLMAGPMSSFSNTETDYSNEETEKDWQPPNFNAFLVGRFQSRKFILAVALTAISTISLFLGLATFDQWLRFNEYSYGVYSGSNVVKSAVDTIGLKQLSTR